MILIKMFQGWKTLWRRSSWATTSWETTSLLSSPPGLTPKPVLYVFLSPKIHFPLSSATTTLPSEFQNLKFLRVLDLSHNGLTGIAENLIKGCEGLKVQKDCWRGVEKEAMRAFMQHCRSANWPTGEKQSGHNDVWTIPAAAHLRSTETGHLCRRRQFSRNCFRGCVWPPTCQQWLNLPLLALHRGFRLVLLDLCLLLWGWWWWWWWQEGVVRAQTGASRWQSCSKPGGGCPTRKECRISSMPAQTGGQDIASAKTSWNFATPCWDVVVAAESTKAPKLAAGPSCDRSRHIHTIRASNLVPSQLHLYMLNAQWSTESARLFASLTESLCWGGSFQPDRSWWLEVAAGEKLNLFSVTASGRHLLLRKPFWRNDNTKRWAYSSQVEHKENCKVGRFVVGIVGQSLWGPLPGVIS